MPASMNYNSLISDIQAYLERGGATVDPTLYNQLPKLINNAEREINNRLKLQGYVAPVQATLTAGVAVYAKPDRWRRTRSMNYGALTNQNFRTGIFPREYEYIRAYWPDDTVQAPPEFYADYDYQHWVIAPTPDQNYPWEVNYWQQPALLDQTNTTNWITQYVPQTLLYRTLLESTPFIKADTRMPTWDGLYETSLSALGAEDQKKIIDQSVERREV
jgi:hypothetical protein